MGDPDLGDYTPVSPFFIEEGYIRVGTAVDEAISNALSCGYLTLAYDRKSDVMDSAFKELRNLWGFVTQELEARGQQLPLFGTLVIENEIPDDEKVMYFYLAHRGIEWVGMSTERS
jgi:hypothetical protein